MLKQLRRKFILLNMASVTAVIVAVLCAIGIASYQQSIARVYSALDESLSQVARQTAGDPLTDFLLNGADSFGLGPKGKPGHEYRQDDSGSGFSIPQLGDKHQSIPVAIYQVSDAWEITLVSQVTSAALSDDIATSAIQKAAGAKLGQGKLSEEGLFYESRFFGGSMYIAFADASSASGWQSLAFVLVGIGVAALAVFFVISLFFSKWALRPVEDAWLKQKQFIADASHELKTPITVILANMSIMLKHPLDTVSSQSQWVESTQREAQGMQDLVTDLLDMARLENEQVAPQHEQLDLSDLAEGCALQFESVAFERNVLVDEEIEPAVNVMGTSAQLERLTTILLDNACKYATPGSMVSLSLRKGPAVSQQSGNTVTSGTLPKGPCALLSVSNVGNEVDPEDLPHLFDRFYRSDKARVRSEKSYGLGLAIAADIVQAHGGAIIASSTPQDGTTFTAIIPAL